MKNRFHLVLMICLLGSSFFATAQYFAGANLAIPTGTLADVGGVGIGAFGAVEFISGWKKVPKLRTGVSVGYMYISPKTISESGYEVKNKTSFVPLLFINKYYFKEPGSGLYALLEGGDYLTFSKGSSDVPGAESKTEFGSTYAIALGLGFRMNNIEVSGRYNFSDASLIGFNVAYVFPEKK
jgi:hypothetical protein